MSNAIEKIFERLSNYEYINNIIPGAIYVVLTEKLTLFKIQTDNIWLDLIVFYFVGVVIGRVGALIIEKILKWRKKLNLVLYSEYVEAERKDKFVRELSIINNMYRTYTSLALCLLLTVGFSYIWILINGYKWSKPVLIVLWCIFLMLLFAKSYIKQTDYVANRVKTINESNK